MRRRTDAAYLFGSLLKLLRMNHARATYRHVAETAGLSAAASVVQLESAERAVKEDKIAGLANALEVPEKDLLELWWLSQGLIPTRSRERKFYTDHEDLVNRIDKIMKKYVNASFNVPVIKPLTPVSRNRGKSIEAQELESLFNSLTGPERERVRGYIEAVLEER